MLKLIEELQPKYYFIENPRGGMRKMEWMKGLPRYTVTYCEYGDNRMKPTDIWTIRNSCRCVIMEIRVMWQLQEEARPGRRD